MTKKLRFGAAGIAMFAAIGMGSTASAQDSDTATATVEVLEALTLDNVDGLDFGTIVVDTGTPGGGTVTIGGSQGSTATCSGQVICSGTSAPASFDVTGAAGQTVEINLPADNSVALDNGNGETITVTEFIAAQTVDLDATTGDARFYVGGTIAIAGTESPGVYSANFSVSVNYQ